MSDVGKPERIITIEPIKVPEPVKQPVPVKTASYNTEAGLHIEEVALVKISEGRPVTEGDVFEL